MQGRLEIWKFGAIHPRVFRPCVRVAVYQLGRFVPAAQWPRLSDYTRGQRQDSSADEFPGRSIGGRDAALRQRSRGSRGGGIHLTFRRGHG